MRFSLRYLLHFTVAVLTVVVFFGCHEALTRPYGYIRLGKASELTAPETPLLDKWLILRHDEKGFSVMSTLCTYDLSPLDIRHTPDGHYELVSRYTQSAYSSDGSVLHGPTRHPLPYYELTLDEGVYGGPKDTLYVQVGVERPKEWRLPDRVPPQK